MLFHQFNTFHNVLTRSNALQIAAYAFKVFEGSHSIYFRIF